MADIPDLKDRPLHDLVEGLFLEHKHDIHLHCHGHLNYKNLYTPPEKASHKPWTSSSKDIPVMRKPSKLPSPKRTRDKDRTMREAIYDFSMGTAGSLPLQGTKGLGTPARKSENGHYHDSFQSPDSRTTFSATPMLQTRQSDYRTATPLETPMSGYREQQQSQQRQNSVASYVADSVFIEELRLPELMLPAAVDQRSLRTTSPVLAPIGHQFVETHLGGITKKDQFNRFKSFEEGVLKTSEMFEKGVLSGKKAVEHFEKKLSEDLHDLDGVHKQAGPSFHRLQIYENAWQALIDDSPIFKEILTAIKTEYEVYMGSLLDTQPQKHSQVLFQQVDNLAAGSPVVPGEVKQGFHHVQELEANAKELLQENDRLREEIKKEQERQQNEPEQSRDTLPKSAMKRVKTSKPEDSSSRSVADLIIELHVGILKQMDDLAKLRCEIHRSFVPISVCHHLDQCVRDTEAEVLKVLSTNEYLEKTIQQLEADIEKIMERGNTPDTDSRLITAYYLTRVKLYKNNALRAEVGVVRDHEEKPSELDNYHFSTSHIWKTINTMSAASSHDVF